MEPTAIALPANAGIVGLLIGAITTLWGWYVWTVKQFESKLDKRDKKIEEFAKQMTFVVKENTIAHTKSSSAVTDLVASNRELHQTITKYIIESAGGNRNNPNN